MQSGLQSYLHRLVLQLNSILIEDHVPLCQYHTEVWSKALFGWYESKDEILVSVPNKVDQEDHDNLFGNTCTIGVIVGEV